MNVLQVNIFDTSGGAARIAWYLFRSYRERGIGSYFAAGRKVSDDPNVAEIPNDAMRNPWSGFWRGVERSLTASGIRLLPGAARALAAVGETRRWLDERRGIEDFHFPGTGRVLELPPATPDILHAHVLHSGYFDLSMLPELTRRIPTVITLHDEWMMTGHCAYTLGCQRSKVGCGQCPDLASYPPVRRDATAFNWERKREIYRRSRFHVATPSGWLMEKVRGSILDPAVISSRVVHNGVDTAVFRPMEQQGARRALKLPEDAWVALFVAHGARQNKYKDLGTIREVFRKFASMPGVANFVMICLGGAGEEERQAGSSLRFVDYVASSEDVRRYYSAADVYLHAARLDNFPNSILEALACGIPVVATAVGGIPEQVDEGITGFLVPAGDSGAMAGRMKLLHDDRQLRRALAGAAAETARRRFSLDRMVDDYVAWYEEILRETAESGPAGRVTK
jgi:glycosyltransferase involved in cell wall biosynthesis